MLKTAFLISFFLGIVLIAEAQKMSEFQKEIFVSSGDTLPYRLLKPLETTDQKSFPLVIFLHGAGERGNDNEVQIKHIEPLFLENNNRQQYPCYVIAPQCPKESQWASFERNAETLSLKRKPTAPTKMLLELIDKIKSNYPIDASRIYITGLSMGGFGTWDLISRYPEMFAAAVPICGGGDATQADKIKNVPLWAFHGAKDRIVAPQLSRKMISALQAIGGLPGYTEYPDVEHDSWVPAYREPLLLSWLFKQKNIHVKDR